MRRLLIMAMLLFAPCVARASQNPVYIAQNSAGANDGTSCANAHAVSFFNTAGNWGLGATQIGAGTVVHLCGTITTELSVHGSGTSGNVITILFETGARISVPFCDTSGCIGIGGNTFILVDGGTACGWNVQQNISEGTCNGVIQATANGSGLANNANGFGITGCGSNTEIRNLGIYNIYVHTSGNATFPGTSEPISCGPGLSNVNIHDNTIHDGQWCIVYTYSNDTNFTMTNNYVYNCGHESAIGGSINSGSLTGHANGNRLVTTNVWDGSGCPEHLDAIHIYGQATPSSITFDIYDNIFDTTGTATSCLTGELFQEATTTGVTERIYNNLFVMHFNMTAGTGLLALGPNGTISVYNNTISCNSVNTGPNGVLMNVGTFNFQNNLVLNCEPLVYHPGGSFGTLDNNGYAGCTVSCFNDAQNSFTSFTQWKIDQGKDASSVYSNGSGNVDSNLKLLSGSLAIGLGSNLTSLGITALDSDLAGNTRPSSGAWDSGTYVFQAGGGTSAASLSPSLLSFGDFQTSTSSPTQTVTLTNTGSASLTISSITFTTGNSGDFSQTNNCGSSLSVGQNCTIIVTFTPTAVGCRQSLLSVADNAPNTPQQIVVSGTGTQSGISIGQAVSSSSNTVQFSVCINDNGDTLIIGTQYTTAGGPVTGVTDGNGNTWTCPAGAKHDDTTNATSIQLCYTQNLNVATQNPVVATVSFTGTPATIRTLGLVYNNVPSGLDQAVNTGCNSSCGASPLTEAISATTVNATNELFVSMFQTDNSSSLPTASAGFAVRTNFNNFQLLEDNGNSYTNSIGVNTCGSIVDTFSGSEDWQAACLTFAPASNPPIASLTPISLQFGQVVQNTSSPVLTGTLKNTGGSTLTFTGGNPGISITGTNANQFSQVNNCGTSLVASASCIITVTFSPTSTGLKNANVSILDNASGSPQTVSLQGTGIAAISCAISGTLTFGGTSTIKCQ
jgi:hypothetical protein